MSAAERRRRFVLFAAYAAVSAVMIGPLVNFGALATASYPGDARLIIWTLAWDNHALLDGLPLFDANIFYPTPRSLGYNEHLFGVSLFTLPIYAVTGNPVLAHNVVWLLSWLLSGLATHAFLRRSTPSDLGAFAGSLIYTFSFYKMHHAHGHLHLVWTWLLPLSLLLLHRWHDRPTVWRLLAWTATLILQVLTSWYIAVIAALANGALLAALLLRQRTRLAGRAAHLLLAVLLIGGCTWPFAREYTHLPRSGTTEAASNSADMAGYLIPPENTWPGQVWKRHIGPEPRWIWGERTVFVGWVALALAAVGLLAGARERRGAVFLYGSLALAGFLLSLGPSPPGGDAGWRPFDLLSRLPGLGAFRSPARFAQIVLLGTAVLAACGVERLSRLGGRRARAALVLLSGLMLSEWYVVGFPGGKPRPFEVPAIYSLPEVRSARAIVSLPDYTRTPEWYAGADYLYYSMFHWRPIVNGFGRTEPPGQWRVVSHMKAFPGPNNARLARELGIDYIVVHAGRLGPGAREVIAVAAQMPEYTLVARVGDDYLFRVEP